MPTALAGYRGPLIVVGLGAGFAAVGAVPVAITFSIGSRTSATIIGMGFVGFGALLMTPGLIWCLVVRTQRGFRSWKRRRNNNGGSRSASVTGCAAVDGAKTSAAAARNDRRRTGKSSSGSASATGDGPGDDERCGSSSKHQKVDYYDDEEDDQGEDAPALGGKCNECSPSDRRMQSRQYRSSESITAQQQRPRCWPSTYVDPPPLIITDNGVRRATTPVPSVAVATVADAKIPSGDSEGELVRVVVDPPSSAAADDDVIDSECRGRDVIVTVTTKTVVTKLDDDDDDSQRLLTSSTVELNAAASTTGGVNVGTPMTGGGVDGPLAADDA